MPKHKDHEESHEKFLRNADDFCAYTIRMLKDEEICPKSARWLGADEIIRIVQRLNTELHRANNVKVTCVGERELRHTAQTHAYALIVTLGEKMVFNKMIYNINADKLTKWLTRKGEVQSWLSRWIKSDEERYKDVA